MYQKKFGNPYADKMSTLTGAANDAEVLAQIDNQKIANAAKGLASSYMTKVAEGKAVEAQIARQELAMSQQPQMSAFAGQPQQVAPQQQQQQQQVMPGQSALV